jgi:hypothetical protein
LLLLLLLPALVSTSTYFKLAISPPGISSTHKHKGKRRKRYRTLRLRLNTLVLEGWKRVRLRQRDHRPAIRGFGDTVISQWPSLNSAWLVGPFKGSVLFPKLQQSVHVTGRPLSLLEGLEPGW